MKFPITFSVMLSNSETNTVVIDSMDDLASKICRHDWAPSIFFDNHRLAANFKSCDLMGLDVDDGLSLDDAKKVFESYAHIIVPTKSHQKEKNGKVCDRYRVLLFLDRKISNREEFAATWASLFIKFPFIDRAAKDCSRMFYMCPHPPVSINKSGDLVKVETASSHSSIRAAQSSPQKIHTQGKLAYSTLRFMNEGAEKGLWNDSLYRAAKDYQQNGRSIETFIEDATKITNHLDQIDLRTIESAYNNEPTYEPRTDYNEGIRKVVQSSKLIVNREDSRDSFLVNTATGETVKMDQKNIKAVLGSDFEHYIRNKKVISAIEYQPHQHQILWADKIGIYSYNSYRPPAWKKDLFFGGTLKAMDCLPEIYNLFFKHLLANDEPSFEYLLDWLALSLQERNMTILTAIGEEGIGKGILGEIMEDIHGEGNFIKVRDTVFKEKFNAPFENRTLVYVDEIKITDRTSLDRIKDVVNWQIEIEKKGEDPKSVRNHASFYLSSNSYDAIPIDAGQRRFSIIQLTDTKLKDSELSQKWPTIQKLVDELRSPENIESLAAYLYGRIVDQKKMLEPFVSERADEVKEASLKDWESWVINDWCKSRINPTKEIPMAEMQTAIKSHFSMKQPPGRRLIEDLGKKFPDIFRVKRVGSARFVLISKAKDEANTSVGLTPEQDAELDKLESEILN